jgi:protein PhnA
MIKDNFGNELKDGDSVQLIKTLKVKGSAINLKKGAIVKNIRVDEDEEETIECKIGKAQVVLRVEFLKKK